MYQVIPKSDDAIFRHVKSVPLKLLVFVGKSKPLIKHQNLARYNQIHFELEVNDLKKQ